MDSVDMIRLVDPDRFAAVLAERLSGIVPDGFYVAAADGVLRYSTEEGRFPGQLGDYSVGRSGTHVRANFGLPGGSGSEHVMSVAVQALDELQDYISEATHVPWPGTTSQPRPRGQVLDSHLHLWYGDPDNVILACEPIPLSEIN